MSSGEAAQISNASVQRVRDALAAFGGGDRIIMLGDSARTAAEAAAGLGCPVGAIVKSLVFEHGGRAVMALVAGDRLCDTAALGQALGLDRAPRRASADLVRSATGFAIGGVSPFGHPAPLPLAIDAGLQRFELLHAAAGHPNAVFPLTYQELIDWTGGIPVNDLAPER